MTLRPMKAPEPSSAACSWPTSPMAAAIKYAELGYRVHPLRPNSKKPILKGWPQMATTDGVEIIRWWEEHPEANIGLVVEGDLAAVDIDSPEGRSHLIGACGEPPSTWRQQTATPGNEHMIFRNDSARRLPLHPFGRSAGLELFDGSGTHYIVVAPSRISGTTYSTTEPLPIGLLPPLPRALRAISSTGDRPSPEGTDPAPMHYLQLIHYLQQADDWDTREFSGDDLVAFDSEPAFVRKVGSVLGIPDNLEVGDLFPCVLPGHGPDRDPSSSIWRGDNGIYVYRCWHQDPGYLSLAEVRASQAYGRVVSFTRSKPEHATWKLRLLIEAGVISPAPAEVAPLPRDASSDLIRLYDGFQRLLQAKWRYRHGEPTPFAWRFASAWCGLTARQVKKAMTEALQAGLWHEDSTYRAYGKEMSLFLPGAGKSGSPVCPVDCVPRFVDVRSEPS